MPDSVTRLSLSALYVGNISTILARIANELLAPLRRLAATRAEFAIIKALILLHADLTGLSALARDTIREARDATTRALFALLTAKNAGDTASAAIRLSSLLLLVSYVFELGRQIADNQNLASIFGLTEPPAAVAAPLAAFSIADQAAQLDRHLLSSAVGLTTRGANTLSCELAAALSALSGAAHNAPLLSTSPPLVDALRGLSASALPNLSKFELNNSSIQPAIM